MKNILIFTLLLACCNSSSAQVVIALLFGDKLNTDKLEFGIVVTPALVDITNIDSKYKTALNLGIYFNLRPDKKFFFHIEGIAKGSFGASSIKPYPTGNDSLDKLFESGEVIRKIKAFSLPLLCRYQLSQKFSVEAGVQPDLFLDTKDMFKSKVNGNLLEYTTDKSDDYTKLDFAVAAGIFYKFQKYAKSMGIGLRYTRGLTDIYKPAAGTQANESLQLDFTIPIGAGKPPPKSP